MPTPLYRLGSGLVAHPEPSRDLGVGQPELVQVKRLACDLLIDWRFSELDERHLKWDFGDGSDSSRLCPPISTNRLDQARAHPH